jgi:ubiquinone biosynthesis protein
MKIDMSANHLARYKQIAMLLWKYGRSDLVNSMRVDDWFDTTDAPSDPGKDKRNEAAPQAGPEQLADDLEAMGPTFVKVGQVLASRPDLLPPSYLGALARLQDHVKPFDYAQVEEIVQAELCVRISKAFSSFEAEPMAAASLGQVHRAALRDGRPVVVKVQRPGIAAQVAEDFEVLAQIAEFLDNHTDLGRRYRFEVMLEEMRITIQQELNYEREAQNLVTVGQNLAGFDMIEIPQPVPDYSTRRVLTMDYVRGRKITSLGPLATLELPGPELAEEVFRAYLKQVLVDGIFHADPHPGNVFVTSDRRIALLDLGMVGHTTPAMQENLLKILVAVSEGKSDEATDVAISISRTTEEFEPEEFSRRMRQLLALQHDQGLGQMNVGKVLLQVSRIAADGGLFVPSELTLLGKTLLQLDQVGRLLDPTFDTSASVRRNVGEIASQRVGKNTTPGSILSSLLEVKDFVTGLPARLNKILDALANAELEVRVRVLDAKLVMEGLQKIANRVTTGIILASLIIGASLLMRVDTAFRIFGYPGLAMIFFLAAAAGGCWLVVGIYVQDRRSEKRASRSEA